MAEAMKIQIGADVDQAVRGVKRLETELDLFSGSITDSRALVKRLKDELSQLDAVALKSKGGRLLATEYRLATTELKALEKQAQISGAATNNALTKGFSAIRSLAYVLPGIGIAGIFNLAFQGISNMFGGIDELARKLKELVRPIQDIKDAATAGTAEELSLVTALSTAVLDQTKSYAQRNNALNQLKEINKAYFGDLTVEKAELGLLKAAVEEYTGAIINAAIIKAFSDEIGKISMELSKQEKAFNNASKAVTDNRNKLKESKGDDFFFQSIKVNDATAAYNKQGKVVGQLRNQMYELRTAIQAAVNESLNFKPLKTGIVPKVKVEVEPEFIRKKIDFGELKLLVEPETEQSKIDKYFDKYRKGLTDLFEGPGDISKAVAAGFDNVLKRIREQSDELRKQAQVISGVLAPAFSGMFNAIVEGENPIKAFFSSIGRAVQSLISQLIEAAIRSLIIKLIFSGATGGIGGIGSLLGGLAFRASGGPVSANSPYVVGERGPELFIPSTSGTVMANGSMGGIAGMAMGGQSELVARLSGNDILLLLNRTGRYQGRNA